MWQIVQQNQTTNKTTTLSIQSNLKVDCAKECPCGVPTIPVPDQWLEVMVTGGFKVWHIIFIIIAFIVTTIVIYCCFHRCRIPRTKQEIEADLMRSNLSNKFRDYLQELPNEQFSFTEALKRVQEIEEKLEQDDAELSRELGARKRMGWIKLKGKQDKEKEKEAEVEKNKGKDIESDKKEIIDEIPKNYPKTELGIGKETKEDPEIKTNGSVSHSKADIKILPTKKNPIESTVVSIPNKLSVGVKEAKGENIIKETVETKELIDAEKIKSINIQTGDELVRSNRTRKRQKPNLSRTKKLVKERSERLDKNDTIERPVEKLPVNSEQLINNRAEKVRSHDRHRSHQAHKDKPQATNDNT